MASEWREVRFGEIYDIPSRNGLTKPKNIRGHGVKFINMGEVFAHDRIFNVPCDRVPITSKEKETSLLANNDLLFARQSLVLSGAGKCSIFLGDQESVAFESHLIRVRVNSKLAYPLFVFYLFKSSIGRTLVWSITEQGAGQSGIRGSDLENITLKLPPLEEQKVIAHILSSLDDKIELNRQMNATLEAMAQALFKSWFVDFDPVIDNALAAGNPIPDELQSKAAARLALGDARKPLPADIQALFPSSFVLTEEMGWIPEGWEVCDFSKIALTNSESWSNKNTPKFITYVDLSNAKNGRISEVIQYKFENAPSRARRVLRQDDTIIGLVRPANKSFAYIFESGLTGSTGFAVMRPKCEFYRAFIYLSLTQQETIDYFAHIADGGAYPAIRPEVVTNHLITKPTNTKIIESFDRIVYPFFKKIGLNDQASKICSEKRDTLLPKLLSGELRIPDAENLAAEVL